MLIGVACSRKPARRRLEPAHEFRPGFRIVREKTLESRLKRERPIVTTFDIGSAAGRRLERRRELTERPIHVGRRGHERRRRGHGRPVAADAEAAERDRERGRRGFERVRDGTERAVVGRVGSHRPARIAAQITQLVRAQRRPEKLRRDIGDLVRLVDDDRVGARQQLRETLPRAAPCRQTADGGSRRRRRPRRRHGAARTTKHSSKCSHA